MAVLGHPRNWPKGAVHITVSQNWLGYVDSLLIRMHNEDYSYDRYCAISDANNKASQLQMFKSLVEMCKEVSGVPEEVPQQKGNQ